MEKKSSSKSYKFAIDDDVYFSFRRYPSNTYVQYHNSYKGFSKNLYKMTHKEMDLSIGDVLEALKRQSSGRWAGLEFESILTAYDKMKNMRME